RRGLGRGASTGSLPRAGPRGRIAVARRDRPCARPSARPRSRRPSPGRRRRPRPHPATRACDTAHVPRCKYPRPMIELRLLGPFEASVPVPGGKPKALLARLALDADRVIAASSLVDDLWEAPPRSATKILQAHVSALRKALGAHAI